jgi:HlyD family secretion protein
LYSRSQAQQQPSPASLVRTLKVGRGDLIRTVRISGPTAARDFTTVLAPILRGPESDRNLTILKLVKSGASVRKGEMLAQIDSQATADHIDDVADMVRQAESDVQRRKAEQAIEWDQLQQTARVAKSDLDKARWDVKASEIRTTIDQELLKLSVDENSAKYQEAMADLKFKKAVHLAELRILEITLERQVRHKARHVADYKRLTVYSPMDGLAVMSSIWRGAETGQVQEGDQIAPGQAFMKVVNTSKMQVEATVNQAESSQFRIGQPAEIALDAFPGLRLKGHVYSIGALAVGGPRQNYYIRNVPVRVQIDGADPRLIPDLSAAADVRVAEARNALVCSRGAVGQVGNRRFVMLRQGDRFVQREVKTGLETDTEVAIVEGLSEGDTVRATFSM